MMNFVKLGAIFVFFVLISTVSSTVTPVSMEDELLNSTELVFTYLVHRHGDRTPVKETIYLSDSPSFLEKITDKLGYGQLTEMGKRRAYQLGKFIRDRYDSYLSPTFNLSEIYIRSTDSTRTKMTVLVAMAAVYRPGDDNWNNEINWVPIPYTTVPLHYDFLMGMNCPTFEEYLEEMKRTKRAEMAPYAEVVNKLSSILGIDLTETPAKIFSAYDVFVSQTNLNLPLRPLIENIMPDIKKATDKAYDITYGNDTMLPLQAGLLLKEFFELASSTIAGEPTPKVNIFSAHDNNVYAFEAISKATPRQGAPMYASAFMLELRKEKKTGRYVVVPVYLKTPGEKVQYLQVDGCGRLCYIEKFYQLTQSYVLDVNEWKTRCKYDENAKFDDKGYA